MAMHNGRECPSTKGQGCSPCVCSTEYNHVIASLLLCLLYGHALVSSTVYEHALVSSTVYEHALVSSTVYEHALVSVLCSLCITMSLCL